MESASWNQVEGVGQLVRLLGKTAIEITRLIAHVDDDRVTLLLDLLALRRLELRRGSRREVVGSQDQSGPGVARRAQIRFRGGAHTLGSAREEEDGEDRKSTRLNSSHRCRSYAVFCL